MLRASHDLRPLGLSRRRIGFHSVMGRGGNRGTREGGLINLPRAHAVGRLLSRRPTFAPERGAKKVALPNSHWRTAGRVRPF